MAYLRGTMEQRISDNNQSKRDIPSFIEPKPPLISNPFMRPKPVKGTNLLELFDDSEYEETDLLQVYLRMKPSDVRSDLYEIRSDQCLVTSMDTATAGHGRRTQHNVHKMYTFSRIFGPETSQKEIFENVVKDNLRRLADGHSYTLLTYGASGSGKTFTLMGTVSSPGLVPRSLEYVFKIVDAAQQPLYRPSDGGTEKLSLVEQDAELQWVKKLRHISAPLRDKYRRMSTQLRDDMSSTIDLSNRTRYYVWVSFVEIYNEAVYDLLVPGDRRSASKLRIREDASGMVFVKGARLAFVRSGSEAYDVMVAGKHNLQVASTGVHAHSSRSHCIFTITMLAYNEGGTSRTSCIRLCDLAGSERLHRTGNTGARLAESRAINSSLHVLERCLHALRRARGQPVPYRESKLTRLLGTGLSGSRGEAVSMVVTVNPHPRDAHETRHVLQLAAVARDIQVNSTIAESTLESFQDTTQPSGAELMKLRADNERLHYELVQMQSRNKELLSSMEDSQQRAAVTMRELVAEAKDYTKQYYEAQMKALAERYRSELEELQEELEKKQRGEDTPSKSTTNIGTPSRHLQNVVTRLQTEITILEEKLNAEKLARERAEMEVQHLRACIEERDLEKHSEDNDSNPNLVMLSDGEEDSQDVMNQSLEPSFRKEKRQPLTTEPPAPIDSDNEDIASDNDENDDDDETLNKTARRSSEATKDSLNDNDSFNNTVNNNSTCKGDGTSSNFADDSLGSSHLDVNDAKIEASKTKVDHRGTYIVKNEPNDTIDSGCNLSKTVKESKDDSLSYQDLLTLEREKLCKTPPTVISKFKKPHTNRTMESNDSLARFEQFEKDMETQDEVQTQPGEDLIKVKVPEKKAYFDDIKVENTIELKQDQADTSRGNIKDKQLLFKDVPKDTNKNVHQTSKEKITTCKDKKDNTKKEASKNKDTNNYFNDNDDAILNEATVETVISKSRGYFDDNEFVDDKIPKEKRTFFDNISANINTSNEKISENNASIRSDDVVRSPSIVKDEIPTDYEPATIKKLLGDSRTSNAASTIKNKLIKKVQQSLDIFDEMNSPKPDTPQIQKTVDILQKSIQNISLDNESEDGKPVEENKNDQTSNDAIFTQPENVDAHKEVILPQSKNLSNVKNTELKEVFFKEPERIETHKEVILSQSEHLASANNTEIDFENIYKDVTASRTTEFDILCSKELNNTDLLKFDSHDKTNTNEKSKHEMNKSTKDKSKTDSILAYAKENLSRSNSNEDETKIKYNLRHKSQTTIKTKRSLRLKRRKNYSELDEENETEIYAKLQDIVNLQTEFSDVTMDVPVVSEVVKDIPSPVKNGEEFENVTPLAEIQSCPSKIVTRSRRKLFTPRAEPLEESLNQTGDSADRLYVPRPSYHRGRARRKL